METQLVEHVWHQNVSILILFVRVAWLVADRGGKSEFGNAVESFGGSLDAHLLLLCLDSFLHLFGFLSRLLFGCRSCWLLVLNEIVSGRGSFRIATRVPVLLALSLQ